MITNSAYLAKYLDVRFAKEVDKARLEHKGMVVTISRDTGCDGIPIIKEVVRQLNNRSKHHPWQFVSKEIFEKSAQKLNINPEIFNKLEDSKEKSFVEEIINSFSRENYPSDFKLKKTYKEVIELVAKKGGVFILGRAGVAIVDHNKRNLHIMLTASEQWRVNKLAKEHGTTKAKTLRHLKESDKHRSDFKKYYMGRTVQTSDYDLVFNVGSLTKKEICSALVSMIEEKGKK